MWYLHQGQPHNSPLLWLLSGSLQETLPILKSTKPTKPILSWDSISCGKKDSGHDIDQETSQETSGTTKITTFNNQNSLTISQATTFLLTSSVEFNHWKKQAWHTKPSISLNNGDECKETSHTQPSAESHQENRYALQNLIQRGIQPWCKGTCQSECILLMLERRRTPQRPEIPTPFPNLSASSESIQGLLNRLRGRFWSPTKLPATTW